MKGHKGHHHRHPRAEHAKGGKAESPINGTVDRDEAPSDVYAGGSSHVVKEAKERKRGGKVKKHLGHVEGDEANYRADRKPRKVGGRAGSNMSPLSSAHHGTFAKGRMLDSFN